MINSKAVSVGRLDYDSIAMWNYLFIIITVTTWIKIRAYHADGGELLMKEVNQELCTN